MKQSIIYLLTLLLLTVSSCNGNGASSEEGTTDTLLIKKDSTVVKKTIEIKDTILSFQGIEIGSPAKGVNSIIKNNPKALPSSDDYVRYMYSLHPFSYFDCEKIHQLACAIYFGHELTEYYTQITTKVNDVLGRVKIYTSNDTVKTIRITFPSGYYEEIKSLINKCYGEEYTEFGSVKDFKKQQFSKQTKGVENHEGSIWRFKHHRIVLAVHYFNRKKMSEYEKELTNEDDLLEKEGVELVYEDYDYYLAQLKEEKIIEKEIKEEEAAKEKRRLENMDNQGF